MKTMSRAGIVVLAVAFSITPLFGGTLFAATDKVVATVKEEPIRDSELIAHMTETRLLRDDALNDLIELKLLRIVAAANGVAVPAGKWSAAERAKVESAIVKALSLPVAPYLGDVVVDHAYLKPAKDEKGEQAGLALMERLRALVAAGATIPAAFKALSVDGSDWHIGDHEEYPAAVIPEEAPVTGLSRVMADSDGYNLFWIHERKVPADEINRTVRIYLLETTNDMVNIIEDEEEEL